MENNLSKSISRSSGNVYYNKWFNEQSSRMFSLKDRDISFDECFKRVHSYITSLEKYKQWVARYQNNNLTYIAGKGGAVSLPVLFINENYIKSALGLPYYRYGAIKSWSSSDRVYTKQIGMFSSLSKVDRYLTIREMMIQTLNVSFVGLPFKNELINAFVTVFHSETAMQVSIHNSYYEFGDKFKYESSLSHNGRPDSNAFGLGQWLGSRLIDLFYYTASCVTELGDPRFIDPSILYHPSIHMGFLAFEMRKGSSYYSVLSKTLISWKKSGRIPSYLEFVSLVLIEVQGIKRSDKKQFKAVAKIGEERKTIASIPNNYQFTNILTKLV